MFPAPNKLAGQYYNPVVAEHLVEASNAMTGALQNNDLRGYRLAAFDFLDWTLPPVSLPVRFLWVVLSPKGSLIYLFSGGVAPDGTQVEGDGSVPDGCSNPLPGVRNILEPNGR